MARKYLGLDKVQMAERLRLGQHGRDTVRRYETKGLPGTAQLAYERLVELGPETEGNAP
jgi:hypothetical protein